MNDLDQISKFAQKCSQTNPVIVIGSGSSVPFGLPSMSELATHLISTISADSEAEKANWGHIKEALESGGGLEQVLAEFPLEKSLVSKVIDSTWHLIAQADHKVFLSAVSNEFTSPLSSFFRFMLSSSNSFVDVVTTNYDRVIEYSCDAIGIHNTSAFRPSYVSTFDSQDRTVLTANSLPVQTVRIWKVHGSLDWFVRPDSAAVRAPLFDVLPQYFEPLIVTPGVSKYERLSDEPFRSTLQGADQALSSSGGFICFGFGFRDRQIEPKMVETLNRRDVPIVVATMELTSEAREFLQGKARSNFLALEKEGDGTRARTHDNWEGVLLDRNYWSIEGFMRLIT